jgi:tagatose-1,6-bisphosphate aldolase non-catalytic subunit AgaZ/GatZ
MLGSNELNYLEQIPEEHDNDLWKEKKFNEAVEKSNSLIDYFVVAGVSDYDI